MTALLEVDDLARDYDKTGRVLGPLSFTVMRGELLVIVGPSGGGKSTLLRCLARLETPDTGTIAWSVERGTMGVVFQEPRLMPWLDVRGNIGFALRLDRDARRRRVEELLALVGLSEAGRRIPKELSGGMAQRASLARGLATDPDLLLLDEPFSALDQPTRVRLASHLLDLQRRLGTTMILVTHDIAEAMRLGDRIIVIGPRPGRIVASFPGLDADASDVRIGELRSLLEAALHDGGNREPIHAPLHAAVTQAR